MYNRFVIVIFFGFFINSSNCILPNSSTIEYINKLCFDGKRVDTLNRDDIKILKECRKDLQTGLAISAYVKEYLQNRKTFTSYIDGFIGPLYTDWELENLFLSTITSTRDAKEFFTNETVKQIDWYGIIEIDWNVHYLKNSIEDKSSLQKRLNAIIVDFYSNFNLSEVLDQFFIRKAAKDMTKSVIMRELCFLEAILKAMTIRQDFQNPVIYKVVFTLYQFDENNRSKWNYRLVDNYIKEILDRVPECLKVAIFTNMHFLLLENKHYNYPYGNNCRNATWNTEISLRKNIDSQTITDARCFLWEFTKRNDGIQIHRLAAVSNVTETREKFLFIPSKSDSKSCYYSIGELKSIFTYERRRESIAQGQNATV